MTPALRSIPIDQPALEAAYQQAQRLHPDQASGWGRAIRSAYEWLMDVWADQGALTLEGDALLVDSANESGVVYRVAPGRCECKAHGQGIPCWHRAARQLVTRMLKEQVSRDTVDLLTLARQLPPQPAPLPVRASMPERLSRAREALALVNELFS